MISSACSSLSESSSRGAAEAPAPAPQDAWSRELERARTANWFHGAIAVQQGVSIASEAQRGDAARAAAHGVVNALGPRGLPVLQVDDARHQLVFVSSHASELTSDRTSPTNLRHEGTSMPRPAVPLRDLSGQLASPAFDDTLRNDEDLPTVPQRQLDVPALRVHVEEGLEGLLVWIGKPRQVSQAAANVEHLAGALRRVLHANGARLGGVVCNGVVVYGEAPAPAFVSSSHREMP